MWCSPLPASEDRNGTTVYVKVTCYTDPRSPFGASEDRNEIEWLNADTM
jgi:hypothetical protein